MNKVLLVIISSIVVYFVYTNVIKSPSTPNLSPFNDKLSGGTITDRQPQQFPPVNQSTKVKNFPDLVPPVVPEEIGLAMVYPQGEGVSMDKNDSNSFQPDNPGSLLTDYKIPESYGESSLTDPYGKNGAEQAARILKINSTGTQSTFKPIDESDNNYYSSAYNPGLVPSGITYVNNNNGINYQDSYNPSNNLKLQASPGQMSTLNNCETTYPNTVKYNNFCITKGDIPYGQVVDGMVNPRLVDRWQSFTGDYSPKDALNPIDGTLYPTLNVLASAGV
jgi:hypothetical protein